VQIESHIKCLHENLSHFAEDLKHDIQTNYAFFLSQLQKGLSLLDPVPVGSMDKKGGLAHHSKPFFFASHDIFYIIGALGS